MTTSYSREYSCSTLRSFQSTRPIVGASLNTGMQMYSNAEPRGVPETGRARKLSAATRWSHGLINGGSVGGPVIGTVLAVTLGVVGCAATPRVPESGRALPAVMGAPIDAAELSRDLKAFAADSMRGR